MWITIDSGKTIGLIGSENGRILLDEEYENSCRVTLEKEGATAPFSITCGIYGLMVHTAFFGDETEANAAYMQIKKELQAFIDSDDGNINGSDIGERCFANPTTRIFAG